MRNIGYNQQNFSEVRKILRGSAKTPSWVTVAIPALENISFKCYTIYMLFFVAYTMVGVVMIEPANKNRIKKTIVFKLNF